MTRRPRTTRVPVRLPQPEGPAARWLRSIRLSGFTIAALCVVVLMVVILAPSLRTLVEQRTQLAQLEAEVAAQKQRRRRPRRASTRAGRTRATSRRRHANGSTTCTRASTATS